MSEITLQEGFAAFNLSSHLKHKLQKLGFVTPTPIQSAAIPVALDGHDIVGIAQTGTGKTLAFGIPIASRLNQGQTALVLAPTRELAMQIEIELVKLGLRTALLVGGAPMNRQVRMLQGRPSAIVATPGRLQDHLNQRTVDLRNVAIAVLDEADRMLDMGFAPVVRQILDHTPKERQTLLFSATMPNSIADLAKQYLKNPKRIEFQHAGKASENVKHELLFLNQEDKSQMLGELLKEHRGTVLVFTRTRHGARKLAKTVRTFGHTAAELHSDRTFAQRKAALEGFKSGFFRILVATDIAARGIDVKGINLVVNYDIPECPEDYVHRIGRTGRASNTGIAITLATSAQRGIVRDIERLLKASLPLSTRSHAPMAERPKSAPVSHTSHRAKGKPHRYRAQGRP